MKNLYYLIIYLFIPFFSLAQEKEYSSQNAFLKGKKYIMDSVYGDPGINIQKIYIDGLPGNGWNELTTIYYNGEEKEGIVLGFFDQVSNEFGLRYYQNIYKNFDRDEAISFFRTLDLIKDRERDYLNDENGENPMHEDVEEGDRLKALEHPAFVDEAELEQYEGLFDDYAEIVLQMGLVSMFTLGLYLTPLLGAGEVLLQIRVDAYKLTALSQRPDPTPAESVGSWGVLMESMGLLAVYCNAGIIVATTKSFHAYSSLQRVIIFFVVEQCLLALKLAVHAYIDDEPTPLAELKKRNAHVVARHKNAVFDDDVDVELMLEDFATEHEDLADSIEELQDGVSTHRLLEQVKLSNERNRIMRIELLLSFSTCSLAVCASVAWLRSFFVPINSTSL